MDKKLDQGLEEIELAESKLIGKIRFIFENFFVFEDFLHARRFLDWKKPLIIKPGILS